MAKQKWSSDSINFLEAMYAYIVFHDGRYVQICNSHFVEDAPDSGFCCIEGNFRVLMEYAFPVGTMGLDEDIDGNPICTDWVFTDGARLTFDWASFEPLESISLFEFRDETAYFSLDLNLTDYLHQGSRLSIDSEWNVDLSSLLGVARRAELKHEHLRRVISSLRRDLLERDSQQQHSFVDAKIRECPICFDKTFGSFSCGHACCKKCFDNLKEAGEVKCPVCRQKISFESTLFS